MRWSRLALLTAVVSMAGGACRDSSTAPPPPGSSGPLVPPAAPTVASVIAVSSTAMHATTRSAAPESPTVRVRDQAGMPIAGVRVTFVITRGDGSIASASVTSVGGGNATCGQWLLGPNDGWNYLEARVAGGGVIGFGAYGLLPDPPGIRYILRKRDGMALRTNDSGYLVLGDDGTFYLVWLYGDTTPQLYVATNRGRYTRGQSALAFTDMAGYEWANGELKNDVVTFRYDDYLDTGSHYIIVEEYAR